ncbi:hypothetical protein [Streptomyces narbonensis]|uniref:hypothetical protein n=1 Tax=Streptomyces narbonensis TaxID=67333 RepID=UPI00340765AF
MSNDFAAIISSINIAVLVIGSIQHYVLLKKYIADVSQKAPLDMERRRVLIDRMKATGVKPTRDELAEVHEGDVEREDNYPPGLIAAGVGSLLWVFLCTALVFVQVKVLVWAALWGAVENPPPAKTLAIVSCVVTAAAIVAVLVESVAHLWLPFLFTLRNFERAKTQISGVHQTEFDRLLAEYRASLASPPAPESNGSARHDSRTGEQPSRIEDERTTA